MRNPLPRLGPGRRTQLIDAEGSAIPEGSGISMPTYRRTRRPSFRARYFWCHFHADVGSPKNVTKSRHPLPKLGSRRGDPINCSWATRDSSRIRRNHGRSTADPGGPLSGPFGRLRIHYFWSHFRGTVGSTKNVTTSRHPTPRLGSRTETQLIADG